MAEALIRFFLDKLTDQIRQEGQLLTGIEEEIDWIKNEFQAMVGFLKDVDSRQGRDENVRAWTGEVRSLVYDAEDVIDKFLTRRSMLGWNVIKQIRIRHQVVSRIRRIRNMVVEVKERRKRYGIQEEAPGTVSIRVTSSRGWGLSAAATPFVQEKMLWGLMMMLSR